MYVLRLHKTLLFQVWHYWWYITCQNVGWNAGEKEVPALLDCAEIFLLRLLPSMLLYVVLTNKCIKKSSLKMVWRRAIHLKSGLAVTNQCYTLRVYFGSNDLINWSRNLLMFYYKVFISIRRNISKWFTRMNTFNM